MRSDHKCVIYVRESESGLVGHPAECHLLRVLYEEGGSHRWQWWAHDNLSIHTLGTLQVQLNDILVSFDVVSLHEGANWGFLKSSESTVWWRQYQDFQHILTFSLFYFSGQFYEQMDKVTSDSVWPNDRSPYWLICSQTVMELTKLGRAYHLDFMDCLLLSGLQVAWFKAFHKVHIQYMKQSHTTFDTEMLTNTAE